MMWGFGMFGFLWMTLFWIGIALIVGSFFRQRNGESETTSPAVRILEDRFARGELDAEEFESRRHELVK